MMFKHIVLTSIIAYACVTATPIHANQITSEQLQAELKLIKSKASWFHSLFSAIKVLPEKTCVYRVSKEDAPLLSDMIEKLTKKLNMAQPALIFIMKDKEKLMSNNACATGLTHRISAIFIGDQLVKTLESEQLEAVLAHELGHLKKRHILKKIGLGVATVTASALLWTELLNPYFKKQYLKALNHDSLRHGLFKDKSYAHSTKWQFYMGASKTALALITLIIQAAYSRAHEKEADMIAAGAIADSKNLGTALQQIEHNDYNNKNAISRWFHNKLSWLRMPTCIRRLLSTHPLTEDRVAYLQEKK